MNTPLVKVISLCVLALGVLALVWAFATASAPVSLQVLGLTAKQWPDDIAQRMGSREYVVATVEFTNASKRPVIYWARYQARFAEYAVLHQTATGWKETSGGRGFCATGLERCTLAPSQAVTFEAMIDTDKPCKVALSFSDRRTPSRLWQRLPRWLAQRLPWGSGWSTVTTDAIDLHDASGLIVIRSEPLIKPLEKTQDIQAAARDGDTDAQFRLAGRYFTGTGVERSVIAAMRWYEAAATNGHAEAAYNLGAIYEYGLGTVTDETRAIEWYHRASDRGHIQAQERLRTLAAQ